MAILWNTGTILFDNFQFIGGMKFGEPSADGRGSAPPELAEQQARAGSEAAPATLPFRGAKHFHTAAPMGWRCESAFALLSHQKVNKEVVFSGNL